MNHERMYCQQEGKTMKFHAIMARSFLGKADRIEQNLTSVEKRGTHTQIDRRYFEH